MKLLLAALAAVFVFVLAPAGGTSPARSYEFLGAKWPDSALPVPYCINPTGVPRMTGGQPIMTDQAFIQVVQNAFNKWQNLPDSYISFRFTGLCGTSPGNHSDGVNTVGWGRLGGSAGGAAFPGASQETPFRTSLAGDLLEVDIIIDDRLPVTFDLDAYLNYLLPVIALHEVGHFLGLGHSERGCAVMAPSSLQLEFCDDDIEGVRILYPGPEKALNLFVEAPVCGGGGVDLSFRWTASREADGYFLDVSLDPFFGGWYGVYTGPRPTSAIRLPSLLPGRPYYWRVWTFGGGLGSHTYGYPFVTPYCFGGFAVPAGPSDLSAAVSCGPDRLPQAAFRWSRSLAASGYYVDLSLDPAFGGFLNWFIPGDINTNLTWPGLAPGQVHYYRVFAFNAGGGFHSYVASFRTPFC